MEKEERAVEKITIIGKDGACIDANYYSADKNAVKGIMVICHGFGEHSGSYRELAEHLERGNYATIVFNQRGHGNLPLKKRGVIPNYRTFFDDIESVVNYTKNEMPNIPIALFGHSMGGNIALNFLLKHGQFDFKCVILEAPWLALYDREISPIEVTISKVICCMMPNAEIPKFFSKLPLPKYKLTGDQAKQKEIENDRLYHNRMTWRLSVGVNDGCVYASKNSQQLSIPMFLAEAKDEEVVCNKAIDELCKACGHIIKKIYESKHAIHNDKNRETFFQDITDFLDKHIQ